MANATEPQVFECQAPQCGIIFTAVNASQCRYCGGFKLRVCWDYRTEDEAGD